MERETDVATHDMGGKLDTGCVSGCQATGASQHACQHAGHSAVAGDVSCTACNQHVSGNSKDSVCCRECKRQFHFACVDPPILVAPAGMPSPWSLAVALILES